MNGYKSVNDIAKEWGMSSRTIRMMCQNGRIAGASKIGNTWVIPDTVIKPIDGRETSGKYKNWRKKEKTK